jgi:hypothetical protein
MNSFWQDIRIIPRMIWSLAFVIGIGVFSLLWFILNKQDLNLPPWLMQMKGVAALGLALFCMIGVLLLGFIFIDAQRRGMRHLMWTLLAIFIPYGIGIIFYFVLRDPLLIPCSQCGTKGRASFVFCPQCGHELLPSCPHCKRAVDPAWNRCAYCGIPLHSA